MVNLLIRTTRELLSQPKNLLLGAITYLSIAHHLSDIWERPALFIISSLAMGTLIFAFIINFLRTKISPHLLKIEQKRLYLFILIAASTGVFIAWRIYNVPASYQSLTIQPPVADDQMVSLLEVKANGVVIDVEEAARKNGWDKKNNTLTATQHSTPIKVSFISTANTPVSMLFRASPQSGRLQVFLGNQVGKADLYATDGGEVLLEMQSRYRGIPNWLFLPALFFMDVVALGLMTMFLLAMQELGQKEAGQESKETVLVVHIPSLFILILCGFVLHFLNALAVPLFLGPDSPSFLQGSAHLLKQGNLDGVSMIRGPGTTFLFTPVMFLFGRNAWGIKILLHLTALVCIPISYRIGWQLSSNQRVAFFSGLIAMLSPDLLFYSNYVMSDVPNIFLVLTFITVLISALDNANWRWIFFMMMAGSFAVLLRSENIVMLILGSIVLTMTTVWQWIVSGTDGRRRFAQIGLSLVISLLPLFWWSVHNQRVHGFFGMSNYQGEVFYDGWVYFGDASRLSFSDPESPAVQAINEVIKKYPAVITDNSGVATGWEIYPSLLEAGYSTDQAFDLMASAAWDSIIHNKEAAVKLLFIKYRAGLKPEITHNITYPLPGETPAADGFKVEFFDDDRVVVPSLIILQRQINAYTIQQYPRIYPTWVLFCVLTIFLSLIRSPWSRWGSLTLITASRIFIPLTLGVAFWRYTLAGWIPAQIIAVNWIWIFFHGIQTLFGLKRSI